MSKVFQMIDLIKIYIYHINEFSGHQKGPSLPPNKLGSVMAVETIHVEIIDNFYLIVYSKRRRCVFYWKDI